VVIELVSATCSHVLEFIGNVLVGIGLYGLGTKGSDVCPGVDAGFRAGVVFDAVRRYPLDPSSTIALSIPQHLLSVTIVWSNEWTHHPVI
jgi:hypothetical protein